MEGLKEFVKAQEAKNLVKRTIKWTLFVLVAVVMVILVEHFNNPEELERYIVPIFQGLVALVWFTGTLSIVFDEMTGFNNRQTKEIVDEFTNIYTLIKFDKETEDVIYAIRSSDFPEQLNLICEILNEENTNDAFEYEVCNEKVTEEFRQELLSRN